MTDSSSFLSTILNTVTVFNSAYEDMKSISDRIGSDSSLSAATAAAAAKLGRGDLATADFDNLKAAIDALTNHLNAVGSTVTPPVNTATVKLAYYKIL